MKISRNKNVAWQIVDGQVLIVTSSDSTLHMLNSIGTKIWELIDRKRTIEELSELICDEFEVEKEKALKEVTEFVKELSNKGIVVIDK
jgi:hypothetical protein